MRRKRLRPREGETVEINHRPVFSTEEGFNAVDAIVENVLDSQFTATIQDGTHLLVYRFYDGLGTTWRFKE